MSELTEGPNRTPERETPRPPARESRNRRLQVLGLLAVALVAGLAIWASGLLSTDRKQTEAIDRWIRTRQYEEARIQAEKWVDSAPGSGSAQFQKARALLAVNQPQQALEAADLARSRGMEDAQLARILGIIHARSGRNVEAE